MFAHDDPKYELLSQSLNTYPHKSNCCNIANFLFQNEVTLDGYQKYKKAAVVPAPLTTREEELQEIRRAEVHTDYSVDSRHQTLSGVAFPITNAAKDAILEMARGSYDYLQFRIGKDL